MCTMLVCGGKMLLRTSKITTQQKESEKNRKIMHNTRAKTNNMTRIRQKSSHQIIGFLFIIVCIKHTATVVI